MVSKRYTIIENYPSIIVDKIPYIHITKFFTYIYLVIYYYSKDIYMSIKDKSINLLLKNLFKKNKKLKNVEVYHKSISTGKVTSKVYKEVITHSMKEKEAISFLIDLMNKGYFSEKEIKELPLHNFSIRVEVLEKDDGNNIEEIEVFKGFNKAAIKTFEIFKNI